MKVYVKKSVLDLLKIYFQTKKYHLAEIELLLAEGTEILLKYRLFLSVWKNCKVYITAAKDDLKNLSFPKSIFTSRTCPEPKLIVNREASKVVRRENLI